MTAAASLPSARKCADMLPAAAAAAAQGLAHLQIKPLEVGHRVQAAAPQRDTVTATATEPRHPAVQDKEHNVAGKAGHTAAEPR